MLKTDGLYRLVFCTEGSISEVKLATALKSIQFIGRSVECLNEDNTLSNESNGSDILTSNEYCVGDAFLSSITFMGCSPYIEFEPPENLQANDTASFCFVRNSVINGSPIAYHSGELENLKTTPRCVHCRKLISNWKVAVEKCSNQASSFNINCPSCETLLSINDLDWRKASGVGNVFIEVLNVYLQEGVPTDSFLQQLETITSSQWQYFYTDSNLKTKLLDRI